MAQTLHELDDLGSPIPPRIRRRAERMSGKMSDRFWDEVGPLRAAGRIEEGTMFGFRCVRAGTTFVAMPGHESDGMVVKLPAERVTELIDSGRGSPVAPAGKVFREWVEIAATEDWGAFLEEALDFAGE